MIDKSKIIKAILTELMDKMNVLVTAALEAKEAATSPESKAENKYDTRGLEASYLAGAQAKRAADLKIQISDFQQLKMKDFDVESAIESTALVLVEVDGKEEKLFFMVPPQTGGSTVTVDDNKIQSLSVSSPLGQLFVGKKAEDVVEFAVGEAIREYEILEVY